MQNQAQIYEAHHDAFTISTSLDRLDLDVIHGFLYECYWARGIPKDLVLTSIRNSFCFGIYHLDAQIGFARVITDYVSHAYLCDVFVIEGHRGQGLGRWLIEYVTSYPELQGIQRLMLATEDTHDFYREHGFQELSDAHKYMERLYDWPRYKER